MTEASYATRQQVEDVIDDLPDSFIECRDMQHRWSPHYASHEPDGTFERSFRCTRCKTKKLQILSSTGGVLRSWYEYAENYLLKDFGRIVGDGRDAIRLASVTRRLDRNGG